MRKCKPRRIDANLVFDCTDLHFLCFSPNLPSRPSLSNICRRVHMISRNTCIPFG
jgi:hypothetical protein